MDKKYKKAIKEFVENVLREYKSSVESITLFGSVARGEAAGESDIDVLVVSKEERVSFRKKLIDIMYPIMLKYGAYISIKTLTPKEFASLKEIGSPFIKNITKEGAVLYGTRRFAHQKG